jgi:hypothetical protein
VCPGCGELAYPRDMDVIIKKIYRRGIPKKGTYSYEAYFCGQDCYDRYLSELDENFNEAEKPIGEQLEDGWYF